MAELQREIADGHAFKLEWVGKLLPKEHDLHLERRSISLLQVELGELKVLLEGVKHHDDIDDILTGKKYGDGKGDGNAFG